MTSRKKKANGGYKVPEYENETKRTWNILLETTSSFKGHQFKLNLKESLRVLSFYTIISTSTDIIAGNGIRKVYFV